MAKKTIAKANPVIDALRKLKEEEQELLSKLKPVQEAISALEVILDKSGKKGSSSANAKEEVADDLIGEERVQESSELFQ